MAEPDTATKTELEDLAKTFFTTKQVGSLLHVKERKIYELASAGRPTPGSRDTAARTGGTAQRGPR